MPRPVNYLDPEEGTDFLPLDEEEEFSGSGFQEPKKPGLDAAPLQAAIERRTSVIAQRPAEPKPKWWQRLAAGAAGGAAGYVNAGGRTRPIDVGPLTQEIMAPGHRRKLSDWQSQVEEAQAGVKGEEQKLSALEQIQRLNTEADLRKRQLEEVNRRATLKPRDELVAVGDGLYNASTKQWVREPSPKGPGADKRYITVPGGGLYDTESQEWVRYPNATTQRPTIVPPGSTVLGPDNKEVFTAPRAPKEPREVDPLVQEMRQERLEETRRKAWEDIENTKVREEKAVSDARTREVMGAISMLQFKSEAEVHQAAGDTALMPVERQNAERAKALIRRINQKYAPRLQATQNRYAERVRAKGGQAEEFVVDPNTLEYRPRGAGAGAPVAAPAPAAPPPQAAPSPQNTTRVMPRNRIPEVVAAAAAKGIRVTPQEAEAQLRQEGWTIQ